MVKQFACSGDMVDMLSRRRETCWMTARCTHQNHKYQGHPHSIPPHEDQDRDSHGESIKGTQDQAGDVMGMAWRLARGVVAMLPVCYHHDEAAALGRYSADTPVGSAYLRFRFNTFYSIYYVARFPSSIPESRYELHVLSGISSSS